MAAIRPMLGDLDLNHVQKIDVDGRQVLTNSDVPAMEGDFLHGLGRRASRVIIEGVIAGEGARERLKDLRERFRAAEPVPFVADTATATRVDSVLIEEMDVREISGRPERFEYAFTLREFTPPPAVAEEEPPEIEVPETPDEEIDERMGTLLVEVLVEGRTGFDLSNAIVSVEGSQEDGTALSCTLSNRSGNTWTLEKFPAGRYTARATATGSGAVTGSAPADVGAGQTNKSTVTLRPGQVVAKAFIVHFWFDKAFIEPCMRRVLLQAAEYARDHADEKLVIVGHSDKVGDDPPVPPLYNQSLSERRARSVHAYLTFGQDRAGAQAEWESLRRPRATGSRKSINDSWGTREYQHILQDRGYYNGNIDEDHGPLTDAAVRTFQKDHNLPVTGKVDNATWSRLIEEYLDRDLLEVPESQFLENTGDGCDGGVLRWIGCGEQDAVRNTTDAWRPNRRTELLFVKAEGLPCEVPKPDTFDMPPGGAGSAWCLGPGDEDHRCCFITRDPGTKDRWLVQPAEPGTVTVKGFIVLDDGTPLANAEYVILAPDGEYMDGEKPRGQDRGRPVYGRTDEGGRFAYPDKPKGIGIYSIEVKGTFIIRLKDEPTEASRGNIVCKRLDGTSDFDLVAILRPGDPSDAGPFAVGEDDYDAGTFQIPPIEGQSNQEISVALKALVRYPAESPGRRRPVSSKKTSYPLVLIAHGMHRHKDESGRTIHSYQGVEYLARHLAGYGYISLSMDHNDLNRFNLDEVHRALTILKHIDLWEEKNRTDPLFKGKVDLDNIGLIGHSRGGEAVVAAVQISSTGRVRGQSQLPAEATVIPTGLVKTGRSIKAVASIAPSDSRRMSLQKTPYLVICGSADSDVQPDSPAGLYDRADPLKSMIYIYGGIHNFFNTHPDWVRPRGTEFGERDIARKDRRVISPQDHLNAARSYIAAFFEFIIRGQSAFKPLFNRYQRPGSLAGVEIHHQYQDEKRLNIDDFEQDPLFIPRFGRNERPKNTKGLPIEFADLDNYEEWLHMSSNAGFIRWNSLQGTYTTHLDKSPTESLDASNFQVLSFRTALEFGDVFQSPPVQLSTHLNRPNQPQDFFVSLVDRQKRRATARVGSVTAIPYIYINIDDLNDGTYGQPSGHNRVFKTIRIPQSLFTSNNPKISLKELVSIIFEFRRTSSGDIS
jgi:outer membrane protein OmpA-like peptidoglycan-associated protein/dienelactone hydrolase